MSSRQRRLNNFFYSMYERFNEIHHLRYLDELASRLKLDLGLRWNIETEVKSAALPA